ncbi:MAG: extracellular solute-binding protein [Alphaproteobacteria bacterium]|mgnify:CR=1 FL=1|jgi:multiple sugar transport system substrate-binding protein
MKTIPLLISLLFIFNMNANAVTLRAVMENVPDTGFIQELLPEFTAKTGIEVEFEVMGYGEMHPKLVPSLIASTGSYDFMPVDFYWVGEFDKAGWMMPLDDFIKKDEFDTSVYFDSLMDLTGRIGDTTYMLPFYNYAMGLTVRKDLLDDSSNQAKFEDKYGMELKLPTEWDEYLNQVEFFTDKDKGFYGVVNQGGKADPIAMEWSNYLFARGGDFHDDNWNGLLTSNNALEALKDYVSMVNNYGPLGAESFGFDEAFNVAAQGNAYSYLTYNFFLNSYNDPEQSAVVGKMELIPVPGEGGLNGAWGWSIPKSSPNAEAAWEFLKWVESPDIAKRRAALGGAPTRKDVFNDPDLNEQFDHYPLLKDLLATAKNFPLFTYTPQFVEVMGTELSKAVIGEQDPAVALKIMNDELEALAAKDGKR